MLGKRIGAFIIDMMIISLVLTIFTNFFPSSNRNKLNEELRTVTQNYSEQKISTDEYLNQVSMVEQDIDKENININLIDIMLLVGYFVMLPMYYNGQTLGKKLFKIKLKAQNGKLTANNLLVRTLIINGLGMTVISLALVYVVPSMTYFIVKTIMGIVEFIVIVVSMVKIKNSEKKLGLHDIIAGTEVVEEN